MSIKNPLLKFFEVPRTFFSKKVLTGLPVGRQEARSPIHQFPLISFTISSTSARNTGFWAIFFSTASMEDRTVE